MQQKLHILIHSMGLPFDGRSIKGSSLGGSETAAYYQAVELAKRGHRVECWTTSQTNELIDGVQWTWIGNATAEHPLGEKFERHASTTPHDVLIIQRHPLAFHKKWAAKICIWQLHDLALHRSTGMIYQGLWQTNAVTCVSQWHKDQVIKVWGLKESALHVIPNGVDPALYTETSRGSPAHYEGVPEGKFYLLYQSRPERGVEHLVKPGGIMDRLRDTDAHLIICGYKNTQPAMAQAYAAWDEMAAALPNVTNIGALNKADLAWLQKGCDLLIYPSTFEEVSCITAMEAMHAGLPMIGCDVGALKETCKGAGVKLFPLKDDQVNEDAFVDAVRGRLTAHDYMAKQRQKQLDASTSRTWGAAVDRLEGLAYELIAKSQSPARLIRHGFEHSDLELACHGHETLDLLDSKSDLLIEHEREFAKYAFADSPEAYKAHYDKHGGIYYDGHEDKVIGENVTGTTRFQAVMSHLATHQDTMGGPSNPMRMLDYGCAHGHYLMPFAAMLPKSEFFGVDINARAIGAAMKWAIAAGISNVTLSVGLADALPQWTQPTYVENDMGIDGTTGEGMVVREAFDNRFDVILAGEVLEHVPDPVKLLEDLRAHLKPGGMLIGTTPVGRWEWTGTEAFREAREHLWHFDKQDLEHMFKDMKHEILFAPAGSDRAGGALGSYVWSFIEDKGAAITMQPVHVRAERVVPRQTISAGLIVKDGETTLRKCVLSFVDWVDEIIIAIDPATTDRTREVAETLAADFPLKPFKIVDGLKAAEVGFAAARNFTLDQATCDWFLWCDADEELRNPWELWKFLKESAVDGFGLGQVHYSADPERVLTKDFPTRLFRISCGARFHGYVHEHPEVKVGNGVSNSIVRHEAKFLHNGYVDEETRRRRYERNYPLLVKDLQENPDRTLNKFLTIRDITQGVMFDIERNRGNLLQGHVEDLTRVVDMFEALIDEKSHVRMIVDALEYYTFATTALGVGFDADMTINVAKPGFPDLNVSTQVKGRFRTRAVHKKLTDRIIEETTQHYESKHL